MITSFPDSSDQVAQKLQYWASQLRDMGRRNRLLFFKDTRASSFIITEPDPLEIFNKLVVQGNSIFAPLPVEKNPKGVFDSLDTNGKSEETVEYKRKENEFLSTKSIRRLNRILSNLRYKARTIREEQGFNALYMTFGMLKWREGISGEFYEAPLILVPVDIVREKLGSRFQIEAIEDEIGPYAS